MLHFGFPRDTKRSDNSIKCRVLLEEETRRFLDRDVGGRAVVGRQERIKRLIFVNCIRERMSMVRRRSAKFWVSITTEPAPRIFAKNMVSPYHGHRHEIWMMWPLPIIISMIFCEIVEATRMKSLWRIPGEVTDVRFCHRQYHVRVPRKSASSFSLARVPAFILATTTYFWEIAMKILLRLVNWRSPSIILIDYCTPDIARLPSKSCRSATASLLLFFSFSFLRWWWAFIKRVINCGERFTGGVLCSKLVTKGGYN